MLVDQTHGDGLSVQDHINIFLEIDLGPVVNQI